MPFFFDDHLVNIVTGINDEPIPPSSTRAGNGSHLIAKYNDFVYVVQAALNSTPENVPQCVITATGHLCEPGSRVVVVDDGVNDNPLYIPANPPPGTECSIMHVPRGKEVTIRVDNNNPFLYKGSLVTVLVFSLVFEFASLIYIGQPEGIEIDFGWVPNNDAAFTAI